MRRKRVKTQAGGDQSVCAGTTVPHKQEGLRVTTFWTAREPADWDSSQLMLLLVTIAVTMMVQVQYVSTPFLLLLVHGNRWFPFPLMRSMPVPAQSIH